MSPEELITFRRILHKYPELSGKEFNTQTALLEKLNLLNHSGITKVGGTGISVRFKGNENGRRIMVRADIDALPIQEVNEFEHCSMVEGVSHKCGHDGHTTILLGLAHDLSENPIWRGEVCLIFQPAEENGKGAEAIINDPEFDFQPDQVFALHNLPGYPLHQVVCRKGIFTAAATSVIIKLSGKTSHAAEPELGINPGLAIAEILKLSRELSNTDTSSDYFRLISLIFVKMGERAYGISAGHGEVHLTLRSWNNEVMKQLKQELMKKVESICEEHQLKMEQEWLQTFFANENGEEAFEFIKSAAEENDLEFVEGKEPFKWGEDFGIFTSKYPGAMLGIGSGENSPALHNPDYDFPDDIIPTGIKMFRTIINKSL